MRTERRWVVWAMILLALILCFVALLVLGIMNGASGNGVAALLRCLRDGSCLGGSPRFTSVVVDTPINASNLAENATFLLTLNGVVEGPHIVITSQPGSNVLVTNASTTTIGVALTQAVVVNSIAISESTQLGTNTSCVQPIDRECYDLSSQSCSTALLSCVPQNLTLDTLHVQHNLFITNTSFANSAAFVANSSLDVAFVSVGVELIVLNSFNCSSSSSVDHSCLHLGGAQCGSPLQSSCVPNSLPFYNVQVNNTLNLVPGVAVVCLGPPVEAASCLSGIETNGDTSGPLSAQRVTGMRGNPVDSTAPSIPSALVWNGTTWISKPVNATNGEPLSIAARDANGNSSAYTIVSEAASLQNGASCVGLGRPVPASNRFYFAAGTRAPPTNAYFAQPNILWYYDSVSNVNVQVGPITGYRTYTYGLWFSPSGRLYGGDPDTAPFPIYEIDTVTAVTTLACASTPGGAFAFHQDGTLYELARSGAFYSFNLATCVPTLLKTIPGTYTGLFHGVVVDNTFFLHFVTNLYTFDVGANTSNVPLVRPMPGNLGHAISSPGEPYSECIGGVRVPASYVVNGAITNTSAFDPVSLRLITSQFKWTNVNNPGIIWNAGVNVPGVVTHYYPWGGVANSCFVPKTTGGTCVPHGDLDMENRTVQRVHGLAVVDIHPSTAAAVSINDFGLQMGRYSILFADNTTRWSLVDNNGAMRVNEGAGSFLFSNQLQARKVESHLGTVTIAAAGPGAGTTPPGVLTVTNARGCRWVVSVTTTAAPAANSVIFSIAVSGRTAFSPGVVFSPRVQAAAELAGSAQPYVASETLTGFSFMSNGVALSAGTNYQWTFQHCV